MTPRVVSRWMHSQGHRIIPVALLVLVVVLQQTPTQSVLGQMCSSLPTTSVCSSVLPYKTANVTVLGPNGCTDYQEAAVSQLPNIIAVLNTIPSLPSTCAAAVSEFNCVKAFPDCTGASPCASMCDTVNTYCGAQIVGLLTGFGMDFNCSHYSTTSCYAPSTLPTIVPPAPKCVNYTSSGGSFCSSVVANELVYLPAGYEIASLESKATELGFLFSFLPSSAGGTLCKQALLKQICSNIFLGCDNTVLPHLGLPAPVPFPQFECRGDCQTYNAICIDSGILSSSVTKKLPPQAQSFILPNCTGSGVKYPAATTCGTVTGQALDDFPTTESVYPASGSLPPLHVSCAANLPAVNSLPYPATLLQPLRNTSFCAHVLPSAYTAEVNVYGGCQDYQESALSALPQLMSALQNPSMNLSAQCSLTVAQYVCAGAYPDQAGEPPCQSMCNQIIQDCGGANPATSVALGVINQFIPLTCSKLPTTSCYAPPTTGFTPVIPSPPKCADYKSMGGSVCADIVTYPFYLPAGTTFEYLEGTAEQLTFLYNFIPASDHTMDDACYKAFTEQLCTNLFLGCDDQLLPHYGIPAPMPFPRFGCRSDCEAYVKQCQLPASILSQLPPAAAAFIQPNCTGSGVKHPATTTCGVSDGSVALDDFPVSSTTFPAAGLPPLVTQCNAITATQKSAVSFVTHCPFPLVFPNDPGDAIAGTSCAVSCPLPLYSSAEYEAIDKFSLVWNILSVASNGFLLVTWSLFDVKRKQTFVLMFCLNVFLLSFALLIGEFVSAGRASTIACKNNSHSLVQSDYKYYCPWQGAFIHVFSLSGAFWWSVVAIDLFIILVLGLRLNKAQTRLKTIGYFLYASGFPLILCLVIVGNQGFGYNNTLGWCFMSSDSIWLEYAMFWAPMLGCMTIGAICIVALFFTLYKSSQLTGREKKAGAWKQYVRPVLFLSEFLFVFAFICSFKFNSIAHQSAYTASLTDYVTCLLSPGGSSTTCGDHAVIRPAGALWLAITFGLCAQGVLNWIVYGTQENNYTLWFNFCCGGLGFSQRGSQQQPATDDLSEVGASGSPNRRLRHLEKTATGLDGKNGQKSPLFPHSSMHNLSGAHGHGSSISLQTKTSLGRSSGPSTRNSSLSGAVAPAPAFSRTRSLPHPSSSKARDESPHFATPVVTSPISPIFSSSPPLSTASFIAAAAVATSATTTPRPDISPDLVEVPRSPIGPNGLQRRQQSFRIFRRAPMSTPTPTRTLATTSTVPTPPTSTAISLQPLPPLIDSLAAASDESLIHDSALYSAPASPSHLHQRLPHPPPSHPPSMDDHVDVDFNTIHVNVDHEAKEMEQL